ncbi:lytic transglycosylase domain-containing protein [Burkholderia vietnamiensis]|uniref:lytic transglycosylase domain-containing protein n=1 Tax=Burkholderia vietnamiensis TaxID=60552 RepID=UPI00352E7851
MADFDVSAFPVSYNDPTYAAADQAASSAVGIPAGWLNNIRTKGEKSNADQVSSAGARTPYQITPDTRAAIIKQTGVDPYLNPNTAAYGAAYLLKQSLDRNGGNPILATAEYHGGTDQANWGPRTMAYVKRVTGSSPNNPGATPSFAQGDPSNPYQLAGAPDTSSLGVGMPNTNAPSLSKVFDAYKSGQMDPQSAAEFEADVNAGKIMLPRGMQLNPKDTGTQAPGTIMEFGPNGQMLNQTPPVGAAPAGGGQAQQMTPQSAAQVLQIPQGAVDAFNSGNMSPDVRAQMQADIQAGRAALPQGATLTDPNAPPQSRGLVGDVGRQLGLTARDALQAAGTTIGLAYDPIAAVLNKAGSFIGHDPQIAPLGAQASALADRLGLPQPVGSLERGVNAAAQGAAEAAGFAGGGGAVAEFPGIVGQLGKVFGADAGKQITAMAAGQAAAQHAKDAGYSPAVQAAINLGTMAMTLGGAAALEGATSRASPLVNDLAQRIYGESKAATDAAAGAAKPADAAAAAASTPPASPSNAANAAPAAAPDMTMPGVPRPTIHVDSAGNATIDGTTPGAANAAPAGAQAATTAATGAPAAAQEGTAAAGAAPAASGAPQFMSSADLAEQARKAVGAAPLGVGKGAAQDALAAQVAPDQTALQYARDLGVEGYIDPDHVTTNQAYRELAAAAKSIPGSDARAAEIGKLEQVGARAQQIVSDAGGTSDLSKLSATVKGELMNAQRTFDSQSEDLYKQVMADVGPTAPVTAPRTLEFLRERADQFNGVDGLPAIERKAYQMLTPREESVNGQVQTVPPTYTMLDYLRKQIGKGIDNPEFFKDADQGTLKNLYGKLLEDQKENLETYPGALQKYEAASAATQMRKSVEQDMVSLFGRKISQELYGAEDSQVGGALATPLRTAMMALPKGNETAFVNLINAVPKSLRQEVTVSGLRYAFNRSLQDGTLNFKNFADWWEGLKQNSKAFNAVMGNLPAETRGELGKMAYLSNGIADSLRNRIMTGRLSVVAKDLQASDGVVSKVMATAKKGGAGALIAGAAHAGGPVGAGAAELLLNVLDRGKPQVAKAVGDFITSPEFAEIVKSPSTASDAAIKTAANSPALRRFYGLAKDGSAPNDPVSREQWLRGIISSIESEHNMNTQR